MPILPIQERYAKRFFPGLIEAIQTLGDGDFRPEKPNLRPMGDGIRGVGLHLSYTLTDGYMVNINISSRLKDGELPHPVKDINDLTPVDLTKWDRIHYSLHYERGKPAVFGFDLEDPYGHHAHILPDTARHTPSDTVTPNVINLDPLVFVEMVAKYRRYKTYPARVK